MLVQCDWCKREMDSADADSDHVIPKSVIRRIGWGNPDDPKNLWRLCINPCHRKKSEQIDAELIMQSLFWDRALIRSHLYRELIKDVIPRDGYSLLRELSKVVYLPGSTRHIFLWFVNAWDKGIPRERLMDAIFSYGEQARPVMVEIAKFMQMLGQQRRPRRFIPLINERDVN